MIRALMIGLPVLVVAWLAVLAIVLRLGGDAPAVFVPFPPNDLVASLSDDVTVTGASPISVTLQSDEQDLVGRVYAAGALLVLPAGLEACIPRFLRTSDVPSLASASE